MEDNHPEAITVTLGGKARRLKLGPAAFRLARLKHGVTLTTAELTNPSFDVFATLAWVGLLPDDPDLKEETVLGWLADVDEGAVMADVARALERMVDGLNAAFATRSGKPGKK